jgi:ATP-binding cassette subfamily B protein
MGMIRGTWQAGTHVARYRLPRYLLGGTAWAASHAVPVLSGVALKLVFDRIGAAGGPRTSALGFLGVLIAVNAVQALIFYAAVLLWPAWWQSIATSMRANLLRSVVCAPGPASTRLPGTSGEAIGRLRDDVEDVVWFVDIWVDVAGGVVFTLTAVAIMLAISPLIAIVVVLPLIAVVLAARALTHSIRTAHNELRASGSSVTAFVSDLFSGALALKAAGAEPRAVRRFRERNAARQDAAVRVQVLQNLPSAVSATTVELSNGLVLLLCAPAMRSGRFTLGDLALFMTYSSWLTQLPAWTGRMMARHRQAGVALERLARIDATRTVDGVLAPTPVYLREPPPRPAPPPPAEPFVRLDARGVTARYPSTGRGVRNAGFTVIAGGITVVTGAVGSGKSTLLRAVLGLLPLDGGTVAWNGAIVDDPGSVLVPPRVAYVGQVPRLFSAALDENVCLGWPASETELAHAVDLAQLARDVDAFPAGLATVIGARGGRLSGGQAQRATVARALVRQPQLLVLDDVSSALDFDTEAALWRGIDDAGMTCLAVSHRRAALERAAHIVVLDRGRVTGAGTFDDVRETCAEFRRLLNRPPGEIAEGVA